MKRLLAFAALAALAGSATAQVTPSDRWTTRVTLYGFFPSVHAEGDFNTPDGDITTPLALRVWVAVSPAVPSRTIAAMGTEISIMRPTVYQAAGSVYCARYRTMRSTTGRKSCRFGKSSQVSSNGDVNAITRPVPTSRWSAWAARAASWPRWHPSR